MSFTMADLNNWRAYVKKDNGGKEEEEEVAKKEELV